MNLRKTVAGAAVALGSTAILLGLGGTAHADVVGDTVGAGADTGLDLGGQLGGVAGVDKLAVLDTSDPAGKIQLVNEQDPSATAILENVDAGASGLPASTLLGLNKQHGTPHANAGLGI